MTDYSPDYTFRFKLRYLAGGFTHDMVVRSSAILSGGEAESEILGDGLQSFFTALQSALWQDFTFVNGSYAYAGSNVFLPYMPTSLTGVTPSAVDPTTRSGRLRATAGTMAGKGSGGAIARLYFYGLILPDVTNADALGDGVLSVGNMAGVATAATAASGTFKAADGTVATFYPRITTKVNDKLLRLIRRTINV